MKQLHTIVLFLILFISINELNAENKIPFLDSHPISEYKKATNLASPTATISGTTAVCQGGVSPVVTFKGIGGTAPYTFTYKINGGADIVSTPSIGDVFNVNVSTESAGSFVYTLVSFHDATTPTTEIPQTGTATVTVNAPPTVDFIFNNDNTCVTQFTSTVSNGSNFNYEWDFGDGTKSTQINPSHSFVLHSGNLTYTYTVKLTVIDLVTNCSSSITKNVVVNQKPDAKLNSNADSDVFNGVPVFRVCSNTVSDFTFFNASSTLLTNKKYTINWGDGTADFVSNTWVSTSHNYKVGLWNLIYTIEGENGCPISMTYIVFVGSNPGVSLGNPGSTDICSSNSLTFPITGTSTNPSGTTYTITFNDGSPSQTFSHPPPESVTHTFLKNSCGVTSSNGISSFQNSFSANIVASNPCGVSSVGVVPIYVSTPPKANFTLPKSQICTNTEICLTDSTEGASVANSSSCNTDAKIVWTITPLAGVTLSSGTYGNDFNSSYSNSWISGSNVLCPKFSIPGTYTIRMKVGNRCGNDEVVKTICVEPPLIPLFILDKTEGCTPLLVKTTNTTNLDDQCTPPTYLWTVTYASGYCGAGSVTIPNQKTANATYNFTVPGTYAITLSTTNSCGTVTSAPQTVVVKQPPTVSINTIPSFCQNVNLTAVANINSCSPNVAATTYLWTFEGGIPSSATTKVPPAVSYAIPGSYSVSLAVTNECGTTTATSNTFAVQVAPMVENEITTVCSGTTFSVTPSNATSGNTIPVGTTYFWDIPVVTGGMTAGVAGTNQATINGTLVNSTTTAQTATYTITPKVGTCSGNPFTLIVTVNPLPIITGTLNICVGTTNTLTASATAATTNPWISSNPAVATIDSGGIISGISSGTSIITYTNFNGCQKTATITVNPIPTVTVNSSVVCSGVSAIVTATSSATGTYVWTVPVGFTNPGNVASFPTTITGTYSVILTTASGCVSSSASGTVTANALPNLRITNPSPVCSPTIIDLTNPSVTVGSDAGLTFTYWTNIGATTPLVNPSTLSVSGTYYIKATNTTNCSLIKQVSVIVNTTPAITTIASIIECDNQPSGAINFSSTVTPVTTFNWTNDTPSIGLAASGTGNITSFTTVNTGTTPVIATITVTPTANGCTGISKSFTITVNPIPTVVQTANQEVCNGLPTTAISFTENISTTAYNWTNDKPAIGLAASGTGDIASFTANNSTSTPIIATITVTPSINGCSGTPKSFTITVNPSPAVTFSPSPQILCSGSATGLVTLNSSTVGATFAWTTSQPVGIAETIQTSGTTTIPVQTLTNTTNADIIITYIATATLAGGSTCLGAAYTYTITVKPKPSITTSFAQAICSNTAFSITPLDGSGNTVPTGTVYTWGAATISSPGAITGAVAQNTAQTSISQTLVNVTDQTATATYTVTPKSGTCSGTPFEVVVTVNPLPKVVFSEANQRLCSGSNSSLVNLSSPTTGNMTLEWTASIPVGITGAIASGTDTIPVQNFINSTENPLTIDYTATATFSENGIDCQGQVFSYSIVVNPEIITSSILSDFNGFNISSAGANDGAIDVTVTGGSGTYTYAWSGPSLFTASTQDISNVSAGNYTLIINDGLCNAVELNFILREPMPILIQEDLAAHKDLFCNGDTTGIIKVDITQESISPYDYELTLQGQGIVGSSMNNPDLNYTFSGLKGGVYTIKVTDANGSSKIVSGITIQEPNGIVTAMASQTNVDCFGKSTGSVTVSTTGGTAPLTYSWDILPTNTTLSASGLIAGTYNLTVTDANGCLKIQQVIITEPDDIVITTDLEKNISCFGYSNGEVQISITGGTGNYNYSWTKNNAPFVTISEDISNLGPGIYEVTVTDANNCDPKKASFTIVEPPLLVVSLISKIDVLCFAAPTGEINVNVLGGTIAVSGYNFAWTGPNGFTSTNQNLSGVLAGTYHVVVTDNMGCTDNLTVVLSEPTEVTVMVATTPIICYGGNDASIRLTISGGVAPYAILWNNLGVGSFQDNLSAGDYIATIIDAKNCVKIVNVNIPEAPVFKIDPIVTQISCFGAHDGSIKLNLVGGKPNLKLTWSDGSTSGTTRNNLGAGTYTVTIIDGTPCEITRTFIIIEPQELVLSANITNALDCDGLNTGAIELLVSGGTAPFSYAWSNGSTTEDLNAIAAGNYLVTVTDARKCTVSASYSVVRPSPITVKVETVTDVNCETKVVKQSFIAKASGGIPPYQFIWSSGTISGTNNEIMNTSQNGLVVLEVLDSRGCKSTYTFDVIIPELGNPSFKSSSIGLSTFSFYSIDDPIQFTNTATGDYTNISWDFGDGTFSNEKDPIHIYKKEGLYSVRQTITYPFGCVYVNTVNLYLEKGYRLIPPNAFTPNNDGMNDYFAPELLGLNTIVFNVYDTWGALIYSESGDNIKGWDGEINNKEAENGNYYYTISAKTFYAKTIKEQGAFVLIK